MRVHEGCSDQEPPCNCFLPDSIQGETLPALCCCRRHERGVFLFARPISSSGEKPRWLFQGQSGRIHEEALDGTGYSLGSETVGCRGIFRNIHVYVTHILVLRAVLCALMNALSSSSSNLTTHPNRTDGSSPFFARTYTWASLT